MNESFAQRIAAKCQEVFGNDAALVSLTTLAGDASSRRYHRLTLAGTAAPQTVIAMELPAGSALPLSSEELAIFKTAPKELPFLNLQRFLSQIGVRVPNIYAAWEADGVILIEDLGDTALWDHVQGLTDDAILAWYQKAIDELLILQIRGTAAQNNHCIAFQQRFDAKLYLWEFDHFIEWGLEKRPGASVKPKMIAALRQCFVDMTERLAGQPTCLNHRDYHSWNLMICDGHVVVIDFQDALLAPAQYDLASLLNDRVTDQVIQPQLEKSLLYYYREQSATLGAATSSNDEFNEIYRYSVIQRDLKVVGRFYYLDIVKGKPGYRKFIPPTVRRLRRNLSLLPQTQKLLAMLTDDFEAML